MPTSIASYRIFIASPSGLDEIRREFRKTLDSYNKTEALPVGALFHVVGWEDTAPGIGRPQALINADIETCDRSIFVFRDRWGSTPGLTDGYTSGCEEEWELCLQLASEGRMRDVHLFFLPVPENQLNDPGDQLKQVRAFRQKVRDGKLHLFQDLSSDDDFLTKIHALLGDWRREHERSVKGPEPSSTASIGPPPLPEPDANVAEAVAKQLHRAAYSLAAEESQFVAAVAVADLVLKGATPPSTESGALQVKAHSLGQLGRGQEAIAIYDTIIARFGQTSQPALALPTRVATALFSKGATLGLLGRIADEVAAYDELIGRFGDTSDLEIQSLVASALVNKGCALGHTADAIAAYDDAVLRFASSSELTLQEQVAKALCNKGVTQASLGLLRKAINTFDELLGKFDEPAAPQFHDVVAGALVGKGTCLAELGQGDAAIAVFEAMASRFNEDTDPSVGGDLSRALLNMGITLADQGHHDEALDTYCKLVARFSGTKELLVQKQVAKAYVNRGALLGQLGRVPEAISAYDDLTVLFGSATDTELRVSVARALVNKGVALDQLGCQDDATAVFDYVVAHLGSTAEPALREELVRASKRGRS